MIWLVFVDMQKCRIKINISLFLPVSLSPSHDAVYTILDFVPLRLVTGLE